MEKYKFSITFFDFWHTSSGSSGGDKYDLSVLKDEDGFPFVSGKTLKGLVSENIKYYIHNKMDEDDIFELKDNFSDFELPTITKKQIIDNDTLEFLFRKISSTQIENGLAKDKSLRDIEVVIPLTLYGEVELNKDSNIENLKKGFALVKRLGVNRNRGLGRCEIKEYKDGN